MVLSGSQNSLLPKLFSAVAPLISWRGFSMALACKSCEDFMLHGVPCNLHSVRVKVNSHVIDLTTLE